MSYVARTKCFLCGEAADILLHRNLKDISELDGKVVSKEPCSKCQKYMQQGIIIIGVDLDKTDDPNNPYRTGHFFVLKEEAFTRIFTGEEAEATLKDRVCYMDIPTMVRCGILDAADGIS